MPQVGLLIFFTFSIIFLLESNQNIRFLAAGLPVEVKRTVALRAKPLIFKGGHKENCQDLLANAAKRRT
jgi:hypothetical protein